MAGKDLGAVLAGPPDILASTPACILTCLSSDALKTNSIQESLQLLVLDEVQFRYQDAELYDEEGKLGDVMIGQVINWPKPSGKPLRK